MILLDALIGIWLLITGAGLIYGVRLSRRATAALIWFRSEGLNGYREIVANGAIFRARIRVFVFSSMVMMGLLTATAQFYPPGGDVRVVISAAFRLLFILMALALTYKSYLEDHELDLLVSEDQRRMMRIRNMPHD